MTATLRSTPGRRWRPAAALGLLLWLAAGLRSPAQLDLLGDGGADKLLDLVSESEGQRELDYDLLAGSHLSDVARWPDVAPAAAAQREKGRAYAWAAEPALGLKQYANVPAGGTYPARLFAKPASDRPIATTVRVPRAGRYRLWLSQVMARNTARPVRLVLAGATAAEHAYGELKLEDGIGREQEAQRPVAFETPAERDLPFAGPAVVWEYWEADLKEGLTTIALHPASRDALVESLFITRSRAFRPSKAMEREENTLTRTFYRYRARGMSAGPVELKSFIVYQWPHLSRTSAERLFYGSIGTIRAAGGAAALAEDEWSDWVDATEPATSSGTYATDNLSVQAAGRKPVAGGVVDVQYAWYPHTGAVIRTLEAPVAEGATRYLLPADYAAYEAPLATNEADGVWGMRDTAYAARFQSEPEALERVFAAMDAAGLRDAPLPRKIRFYTTCRVSPAVYDLAVPRLAKLGVNWLGGVPGAVAARHGMHPDILINKQSPKHVGQTHDPMDPLFERLMKEELEQAAEAGAKEEPGYRERVTALKMGDEIGPVASAPFINGLPDCRAAFQEYLAGELARMGKDASFFGLARLADADFLAEIPADAGLYQRRLFYHSRVFTWLFTSAFFERFTRAAVAVLPNVRTSCNYTPGSLMHAGVMMSSDWFALPRHGGATMAWGEDWLGGVSHYSMAGIETVSYYGAVVDCAARARGLPGGFYLVCRTGAIDRKIFALVARGVHFISLYDWGPEYTRGAVDTFSNLPWTYAEIGRATRALGPADTIVADGAREPRRVALLYNRTQEYWRGAPEGAHFDRLLTYLALTHAHVPVDLITEEDLTAEALRPYRVVYVQGRNMARAHLAALAGWVRDGGVLVATAGTAMCDEYNDPLPEAAELFGARQRVAGASAGSFHPIDLPAQTPIDTLTLTESDLTPALAVPVVGLKVALEPASADAKVVGTYADGTAGAVVRAAGKGRTLLLGVMPGHLYRHNAPRDANNYPTGYTAERRALIARPALGTLGRQRVEYSEPLTEATLYEHESGLAVLLGDFSYAPGRAAELSVEPGRPVREVVSTARGPLEWTQDGSRITVRVPVPDPVDVVIIR